MAGKYRGETVDGRGHSLVTAQQGQSMKPTLSSSFQSSTARTDLPAGVHTPVNSQCPHVPKHSRYFSVMIVMRNCWFDVVPRNVASWFEIQFKIQSVSVGNKSLS
ncbi:uncharacterized protein TRIVIDRAFT_215653 [Trichoderma virens Gv29-8]|uniref:Uncharacterized protein n=1 Tax=Hypocrea virens (strain Gv29-8 / FGSC 10586) TaxID=413071 RepID=G9MMY4_HYPVG|nr:uncharacterized protein TRIVIDRAFT_215653 [Trichoderma virens Gv29-8]EHK24702.1 hypothetical protein TRIVIDRAFT_215653 [Trichoderma virens Gv29-8]